MDQVESQTTPSPQNLPERPSFWYLLRNPPTYHKPLVTLVAVTFFLSALGTIVYFTTIGKGQISFSPPPTTTQKPTVPAFTLPTPTPTPDLYTESSLSATANWKTYTSDKFTFKYPANWDLTDCGDSETIYLDNEMINCAGGGSDIEIINTFDKESSFSLEKSNSTLIKERIISLGGKNALQADIDTSKIISSTSGFRYTVTRIKIENSIYDIIFNSGFVLDESSQRDIYDQILSTFQFTD